MNKLTAEQVREAIFDNSSYASYDGAKYYADGINMQAIAATLGSNGKSRWERLFGTPEMAARTFAGICEICEYGDCATCGVPEWVDYSHDYDELLEWLKGVSDEA